MQKRIAVVGAGIVGAGIAYEIARAGGDVVLVDQGEPGSGVTARSFAWIGEPRDGDPVDASTPLRRGALTDWHRWEDEVPGVRVQWRGALLCGEDGDADASQLEPHLRQPPPRSVFLESHGAVDPVAVTRALVSGAQSYGARLSTHTPVSPAAVRAGLDADVVVIAAGTGAPALLGLELPVTSSPALLVRFAAPPGLVRTIFVTPDLEVREAAEGELLVAAAGDTRDPGPEMLRRLTATFDAPGVRLLDVRVGARPMPADGMPLIGPVPGLERAYVAVMHSGITLAPKAARLIAGELVDDTEADELAGLRLSAAPR
ncbi:FAD-binding oxidoreductase [Actinoplanes sp. TRM 88003]|uniref:FAD-binding oxidoreductase n=1 Tax=Paractinoplanes aksuensis TaxID=2939490 RepID=A0ABT1DTH2_9ACTN|nr:FAD-dependent oxidoreductase [Actinoplanes aksuensis]MCO8274137.1 FAD-binding oxidoreductase [Actinoplanes aksuensis]